ncbi:MAG: peptide-methionine (S)-S-oxide reductase MsrA [Hyphomicrobiaceae bacterium]
MRTAKAISTALIAGALAVLGAGLADIAFSGRSAARAEAFVSPKFDVPTDEATFAAGCFWCTESDFDKVPGVLATISGFTGGRTPSPTYEQVSTGRTGHAEAVRVIYDPKKVTYQALLAWYWRHVDPTDGSGQFCDRGNEYRPAIFVHSAEQRSLAEKSRDELAKSGILERPIAVEIADVTPFTAAEDYHQDFYRKNPLRYKIYRHGCGRDQRIEQIWSKAGRS